MNKFVNEIKGNFEGQPTWIIHDVKTFQYFRLNDHTIFERENLGGGNILSIIGLFSVLNYFSKIYKILKSGKLPRKNNGDKKNTFVEDQAFKTLINDYHEPFISPTQDNTTSTKAWQVFRNALSHVAQIYPEYQALVVMNDSPLSSSQIQKLIESSLDTPITIYPNGTICFVDKLILYVELIRDWIISDMENKFPEKNIELAAEWMKNNTLNVK